MGDLADGRVQADVGGLATPHVGLAGEGVVELVGPISRKAERTQIEAKLG